MVDYELKAQVTECGLVRVVSKMQKAFYKQSLRDSFPFPEAIQDSKYDMPFDEAMQWYDFFKSSNERWKLLKECERILHASNARKNRVKKRVENLLEKSCVFFNSYFFRRFYEKDICGNSPKVCSNVP